MQSIFQRYAPQFRQWRRLLFWPVFLLLFTCAEHWFPAAHYYIMHCRLDDLIPFRAEFVLPYLLWFPFVGGMLVYTLFRDLRAFRHMMDFIILTYSTALLCFFLFPTCQHLRPVLSAADPLTRLVSAVYGADTSTNVCPSIHVIGALAVWFAARETEALPPLLRRRVIPAVAVLICLSTVFLKQHSALDVLAALAVCGMGFHAVYRAPRRIQDAGLLRNSSATSSRMPTRT